MVLIVPFVGAAVFLSGLARALPTSDYSSSGSSSNYGSSGSSDSSSSNYGSSGSSSNYGSSGSSNYGSSGSSGYGSSGSSSYGSSGSSNYGGSSNNQDTSSVDNQYTTSSAMMMDSTSTMMMDSTSTAMMMDTTSSTMNMDMTSTTTAMNTYQTSSYGSGSSYWGGSGYEDCVNQCIAQFGGGSTGGGSYQATATVGNMGSYGTGSTHTVVVAPTKGVFRFVPFATNASVGDTIEFHWGADEHTVTKSSALTPCNKSSENPVFASGEQNTSFVFTQVVNDTNPTFYYCGTPTHCEKGMFGVINPTMATPGAPTSLGGMMSSMAANDSDLSAYAAYSSNVTASNNAASSWGENIDMSALPAWSHPLVATNALFTRNIIAMNPELLTANNTFDLSSVANTPMMIPKDLTPALDAASAPASSAVSSASSAAAAPAGDAATAAASPASSSSASATPKGNSASSVASPRMLVGAVVVLATIFAL